MRKRVIRQLEELLYKNEYVVVPGLGAFLRHTIPSEVDDVKGLIYPPKNSLSFNASLSQSDGVLLSSYVKKYGVSQKKAEALLREDVRDLLSALRTHGLIRLGGLGRIWLNSGGKIEFVPDANHPYTTYFFGYVPVVSLSGTKAAPLLINKIPEAPKKDVVYLPINLSVLKYSAAAAILVLALFLFPKSVIDKAFSPSDTPQYPAGFLTSQTHQSTVTKAPTPSSLSSTTMETISENVSPQSETKGLKADTPYLCGLPLFSPEKEGGAPKYYIIVATLRSENAVRQYLEEHDVMATFPNVGIVHTNRSSSSGGTYRVFVSVSENESEARSLLKTIHESHRDYGDAWVYQYPLS